MINLIRLYFIHHTEDTGKTFQRGSVENELVEHVSYAPESMLRVLDRNLPLLNGLRGRVGVPPLVHMDEIGRAAPRILYFTAEPFEYPCPERPLSAVMIGPTFWEPPVPVPDWLAQIDRPIVLVTCSTEYQADGVLVRA